MKTHNRIFAFDLIKSVALLMVIAEHLLSVNMSHYGHMGVLDWWVCNFLESFARPAVALFFVVTGALLLDGEPLEAGGFLWKRITRVAVPYLGWTVIYMLIFSWWDKTHIAWPGVLVDMISGRPGAAYHLWFLYTLIFLYLIVPILNAYVKSASNRNLDYFLTVWFAINALKGLCDKTGRPISADFSIFVGFAAFFVLGHRLRRFWMENSKPPRIGRIAAWSTVGLLFGLIVTAVGTYTLLSPKGNVDDFWYGLTLPNTVIMTVCLFNLLMIAGNRLAASGFWNTVISYYSKNLSFGVYLVHIIVLNAVARGTLGFSLDVNTNGLWFGIPATLLAVVAISGILVELLRRNPVTKYLVK